MNPNKVVYAVIFGDSNFGDYDFFCEKVNFALTKVKGCDIYINVIAPYDSGASKLAQLYAREQGYDCSVYGLGDNDSNEALFRSTIAEIQQLQAQCQDSAVGVMAFGNSPDTLELCKLAKEMGLKIQLYNT